MRGALQHHDLPPCLRGVASGRHPGGVVVGQVAVVGGIAPGAGAQPRELPGVRGQHGRTPAALPPAVHRRERAERLGVEHDRCLVRPARVDQLANELGRRESRAQPRPDDDRVMLVVEDAGDRRLRVDLLDVVLGKRHRRRLDDLGGEERLQRFGHREGDEPRSRPPGRAADEQRRPRIVERSGDDQQLAERALVATCRARREQRSGDVVVEPDRAVRQGGRRLGRGGGLLLRAGAEADRPLSHRRPRRPPRGARRSRGPPRHRPRRGRAAARSGPGSGARGHPAAPRCRAGR